MYFDNFDLIGKTLFQAGLNSSRSGNISIFDRKTNTIYIKRSGAMLHALKITDIVAVDITTLENSEWASSELPAHIALYKNTDASAIVHCHPPTAVGISLAEGKVMFTEFGPAGGRQNYNNIPLIDVESKYHLKTVPITPVSAYGKGLATALPPYFNNDSNTVVVRGHGSFSIGETLEECLHYATTLEQACKIFVTMNNLR